MILMDIESALLAWDDERKFCGDTPEDVSRKINSFLAAGRDDGTINNSRVSEVFLTVDPDDSEKSIYCATVFYNKN